MEDLDAASLDDVKEWYRTYYGPNNCVLSLAGDITPERALELVKKYFNGIPPGPPLRRAEQWVPRFERNVREEAEDRVPQPLVYRTYHVPGWRDADVRPARARRQRAERLEERPARSRGWSTRRAWSRPISAGVDRSEIAGTFDVQALLKPGVDPAAVEKEIDAVVEGVPGRGPDRRGAAARAEPHALELRPRHRGARRLRRPRRRPGREPDLRRQQRGLPRSARAHGHRHAGAGQGGGGALARRAALHDGGAAVPGAGAGPDDARSQGGAGARRRAGGDLPRRPAHDAEERPEGGAARAARDADRQRRAGGGRRLRRRRAGQGRPRRARAQPAGRRHDARATPSASSTSSTRSAPASRRAARSTCRSCACRRCRPT